MILYDGRRYIAHLVCSSKLTRRPPKSLRRRSLEIISFSFHARTLLVLFLFKCQPPGAREITARVYVRVQST